MLKLGAYEAWFDGETIVPGDTLQERLANLETWGYQGIQLSRPSRELGLPTIKNALAGSGVRLCIYGGGRGLLSADPVQRQAAVEQIGEGLRVYMNRGWFSSGKGERLALVVATPNGKLVGVIPTGQLMEPKTLARPRRGTAPDRDDRRAARGDAALPAVLLLPVGDVRPRGDGARDAGHRVAGL